jgi:DivIVA domain-containing protein
MSWQHHPVLWVELAVAVVILAGVALLAGGRGGGLPRAWSDRPDPLPQPPWDAASVERLRFGVGFRGYRMDEVDAALDRIAAELAARDAALAELQPTGDPDPAPPAEPGDRDA